MSNVHKDLDETRPFRLSNLVLAVPGVNLAKAWNEYVGQNAPLLQQYNMSMEQISLDIIIHDLAGRMHEIWLAFIQRLDDGTIPLGVMQTPKLLWNLSLVEVLCRRIAYSMIAKQLEITANAARVLSHHHKDLVDKQVGMGGLTPLVYMNHAPQLRENFMQRINSDQVIPYMATDGQTRYNTKITVARSLVSSLTNIMRWFTLMGSFASNSVTYFAAKRNIISEYVGDIVAAMVHCATDSFNAALAMSTHELYGPHTAFCAVQLHIGAKINSSLQANKRASHVYEYARITQALQDALERAYLFVCETGPADYKRKLDDGEPQMFVQTELLVFAMAKQLSEALDKAYVVVRKADAKSDYSQVSSSITAVTQRLESETPEQTQMTFARWRRTLNLEDRTKMSENARLDTVATAISEGRNVEDVDSLGFIPYKISTPVKTTTRTIQVETTINPNAIAMTESEIQAYVHTTPLRGSNTPLFPSSQKEHFKTTDDPNTAAIVYPVMLPKRPSPPENGDMQNVSLLTTVSNPNSVAYNPAFSRLNQFAKQPMSEIKSSTQYIRSNAVSTASQVLRNVSSAFLPPGTSTNYFQAQTPLSRQSELASTTSEDTGSNASLGDLSPFDFDKLSTDKPLFPSRPVRSDLTFSLGADNRFHPNPIPANASLGADFASLAATSSSSTPPIYRTSLLDISVADLDTSVFGSPLSNSGLLEAQELEASFAENAQMFDTNLDFEPYDPMARQF